MRLTQPTTGHPPPRRRGLRARAGDFGAALGLLLVAIATGRAAHAADVPRVMYLGTEVSGLDPTMEKKLDAAAEKGIRPTAVIQVPIDPADVPRTAEGHLCSGPTCIDPIARKSKVDFFVRAEVRLKPDQQCCVAKIQAIRATPFAVVVSDEFDCENDCKPLDAWFQFPVSAVMAKLLELPSPTAGAPSAALPVPVPPGKGEPGADLGATPGGGEPHASPVSRFGPWVLGGLGAAAVVGGVVVFARGERSSCSDLSASECGKTFNGHVAGAYLAAAGAAAVGGAILWRWSLHRGHASEPSVAASIAPGGLVVHGSF